MATKPSPSWKSLIGGNAVYAGIDQGIDFTGSGPVHALDAGKVTRLESSGSGWPGEGALLVYQLTAGPAKGRSVYTAEDFTAAQDLAVGSSISKGQVIGQATGSGKAPGIETGWAQASGIPVAPLPPPRPANQFTPQGAAFANFVTTGDPNIGGKLKDLYTSSPPPVVSVGIPGVGSYSESTTKQTTVDVKTGKTTTQGGSSLSLSGWIKWITNPDNLKRIGQVALGAILLLLGIAMLGRSALATSGVGPTVKALR